MYGFDQIPNTYLIEDALEAARAFDDARKRENRIS